MRFPSITNYTDAIRNLEYRLRTLKELSAMFDSNGEPLLYASKGYVTYSIQMHGRIVSIKCFTSILGCERLTSRLRIDNGYGTLFEGELFVFDDNHVGDYYSIIIEDFAREYPITSLGSDHEFVEGLKPFCENGLWGYVSNGGNVAIEAIYDEVEEFSEGRAVVTKDGLQGLINRDGVMVLDIVFDEISWDGSSIAYVERGGKWGCYDRSARQIIECKYDWMGEFSCSLLLVKRHDKYGYVDLSGKEAIALVYDSATSFDENGIAIIKVCGKELLINTKGVIEA